MENIFRKLDKLSQASNGQLVLYKNCDLKNILKGVGKIPGKFDSQYLEFLKFSNGASVFDYCFLGFKNSRLGTDIDKFMLELWSSNNFLALKFLAIMGTSSGDILGYLIDLVDEKGNHPIAYYSSSFSERIFVIASTFQNFMQTFIDDVNQTLSKNQGKFIVEISEPNWPYSLDHWLSRDEGLRKMHENKILENYFKKNMPSIIWN